MLLFNQICLPVEELSDEAAATISGGLFEGGLQLPMISLGGSMFPTNPSPVNDGAGTSTKSPEESIQEASEEKQHAEDLITFFRGTFQR